MNILEIKKRMFAGINPLVYVFGDGSIQSWALQLMQPIVDEVPRETLDKDLEGKVRMAADLNPILLIQWAHVFHRNYTASEVLEEIIFESGNVDSKCVCHAFFASESDTDKLWLAFVKRYDSRALQQGPNEKLKNTFSYSASEGELLTELIIGIDHLPAKHPRP